MSAYPEDLLYHGEHAWARLEGERARFGITEFAQESLGEIVYFEAPAVGATVARDRPYAEIESSKAISDVFAPLSGEVIEVNPAVDADPALVNADPHGEGWLIVIRLADPSEAADLLDAAAYGAVAG